MKMATTFAALSAGLLMVYAQLFSSAALAADIVQAKIIRSWSGR